MWLRMKEICKFTPRAELEKLAGPAKFQLEDRPAYYHGGGFVVCYSPMRFRVEGLQRVEYGQPGEYAVGLYHFSSDEGLRLEMGLDRAATEDAAPIGRRSWRGASPTAPPSGTREPGWPPTCRASTRRGRYGGWSTEQ